VKKSAVTQHQQKIRSLEEENHTLRARVLELVSHHQGTRQARQGHHQSAAAQQRNNQYTKPPDVVIGVEGYGVQGGAGGREARDSRRASGDVKSPRDRKQSV
jgi:hypothetical protein